MALIGVVCVVMVSGVFQIRLLKPYAEVEDIQRVLVSLRTRIRPGDGVYIYPGAVSAVDFYVKKRDRDFMYGDYHRKSPEMYASEMQAGLGPEASRVWIVFSHIYRDEDQRILRDLSNDWNVEAILSVQGAALYLASRRQGAIASVPSQSSNIISDTSKTTLVADHTHDSFWQWNVRNSRHTAR